MRRVEHIAAIDGGKISLAVWDDIKNPKGMVQIIHGMAEHIERYDDFARFLNKNGYIVIGDDHRGHGKTCGSRENMGIVSGDGDIFYQTLIDEIDITKRFEADNPDIPIVILGHSYGSFLAQRFIQQRTHKIAGFILSGSAYMKGAMLEFGRLLAKGNKDKEGKIFANMTFKSYDKKFNEGLNAWLSRDKKEVEKYNADEFCGKTLSRGFYRCFFRGLHNIYAAENWQRADRSAPILITSGGMDAVGGYGKQVERLKRYYSEDLGFNNVRLKLYPEARHEILNETNRAEVYADLLAFINECTAKAKAGSAKK